LIERGELADTASHFGLTVAQVREKLGDARAKLWEARKLRPKPHRDDKVITAWNGSGPASDGPCY